MWQILRRQFVLKTVIMISVQGITSQQQTFPFGFEGPDKCQNRFESFEKSKREFETRVRNCTKGLFQKQKERELCSGMAYIFSNHRTCVLFSLQIVVTFTVWIIEGWF